MPLDERMRQRLIDAGILRSDGITRRLSVRRCPGCGVWIMAALDGEVAAVAVYVDAGHAGRMAEFLAISQGRRTFEMVMTNRPGRFCYTIEPRRAYHMRRETRHPVLIEHRCGQPIELESLPQSQERNREHPPF